LHYQIQTKRNNNLYFLTFLKINLPVSMKNLLHLIADNVGLIDDIRSSNSRLNFLVNVVHTTVCKCNNEDKCNHVINNIIICADCGERMVSKKSSVKLN
jgi:hypothetical protein